MDLDQFLKTFLGIESIELKEDGSAVLDMLAKEGEHIEQSVSLVLVPNKPGANITQLEQAFDKRMELESAWLDENIERQIEREQAEESWENYMRTK